MTDTRIPIVLLTGFLGSGKTTLLNRLIHQPEFAECAVIINEFGAIGLDQALVADRSDDQDIQLLDSGCLCCLASSDVQNVLGSLYYRRLRQEIPYFKRVLIETSGLAEPGPIINSILGDGSLNQQYRIAGIITVLDSLHAQNDIAQYPEAEQQLMMADALVLTKFETTPEHDRSAHEKKLRQWLQKRNPTAHVLDSRQPDSELAAQMIALVDGALIDHRPDTPASSTAAVSNQSEPHEHLAQHDINSVVHEITHPVCWPAWAQFVQFVQQNLSEHLLRFKGILAFEQADNPMMVHAVHHLFSPPEAAGIASAQLCGQIVFIFTGPQQQKITEAVALLEPSSSAH